MWGNETEVLDGTQLAADYTFAGLQKFGQGLEERLRGLKMKSKILEKVRYIAALSDRADQGQRYIGAAMH